MPVQAEMRFKFSCSGEGATMASYSYLKEPSQADSGYTRGMRTGSMNYLENGTISKFKETYTYLYGNSTPTANSSSTHNMEIDFDGSKGISEFNSQGFYKNNRLLSAWKKIKYEIINKPVLDKQGNIILTTRTSRKFSVNATTSMDMTPNGSYEMIYDASVWDGVIETRDETGWSNKTGASKVDWEHDTRSTGNYLTITNELLDKSLYFTLAGPSDWLPCCYSGTLPVVVNKYSSAMLLPQKILPNNASCIECRKDCLKSCIYAYTFRIGKYSERQEKECLQQCNQKCAERCTDGSCEGFECIYTYENTTLIPVGGLLPRRPPELSWIDGLIEERVTKLVDFGEGTGEEEAQIFNYTIIVKNTGGYDLNDVIIDIGLEPGIKPEDKVINKTTSSYSSKSRTEWSENIGALKANQLKPISFEVYIRAEPGVTPQDKAKKGIGARARGKAPGGSEVMASNEFRMEYIPMASGIAVPV